MDMLERLAGMRRKEDSSSGFEAKPDMLSITGMTLEQFANLMQGLGYKAERGEREKPTANAEAAEQETSAETPAEEVQEVVEKVEEPENPVTEDAEDRIEVFYTFAWGGNRNQGRRDANKPTHKKGKPKPKGKPRDGGGRPKSFQARPPKKDKIDPDNPFAQALMGLKDKGN